MSAATAEHTDSVRTGSERPVGGRFLPFVYDPFLAWGEQTGMGERRRRLLAHVSGNVLEVGAGTGLNLPFYPRDLDRLVVAEPNRHMLKRLRRRLSSLQLAANAIEAPAEALPFDDSSFDAVVSTLVLCTVEDPTRGLEEIRRVLRPGGSLLFIEHVRADDARLARWQDRLHRAWRAFADGCNCNRPTLNHLHDAGFAVSLEETASWRRMPPIVRPLIRGRATPIPARRDESGTDRVVNQSGQSSP